MANQIVISSGAKVRNLNGVLTGTTGVVNSLGINVANGIPQLDGSGKILVSQLPNSVMEYKGTWNAATNTPTLVNGTGNQGDVYLCNVAGTVNFGAGAITFAVGDQAIYSGTIWQKAGGSTGTVTSVAVTETGDALTITGSPITTSGTINIGFAGISSQYVNGAGGLTTFPSLTGYVPYTGATGAVNLGAYDLTVNNLTIGKGTSSLSNNSALGYRALFHITTGNYNTAVGYESLHNTTTGQYNTGIGQSSLFTNTTGSQNTALGLNALLNNTTGGSNVVVGLDALQHNSTGSSNTALGYNAGSHITGGSTPNTTASNSVYIGRDSKAKVDGGANEIVIGYNAIGNGSNTATFGNTSTTANYFTGSINGGSFVKSGGTSSQFLKADGSVDSNSYVTVDTTQTITGAKTFSTFSVFNSSIYANAEIRLANAGTSSVSFLQNLSSVGTVSTGANMLGFNTNKDLYIASDGKGYSVIAFNNGGTGYTYTLPALNGTIALTSQLTSGTVTSVGLSSATSGVTIGSSPITTSGTITLAIATASGSQNGLLSSTDWTTFNNKASTADLANYLPLTGGTLSGALNINLGSGTGLNVASDLVVFRASTGFATPRQITLAAGNGATTYLEAKGYGGNYITDFGIRTYNASGTAFEVFFATSAGDVGIGTTAPAAKLDVNGTGRFTSSLGIGNTPTSDRLSVTGIDYNNTAYFLGGATTGASYGLQVRAGTNSTDYALQISNRAGSEMFRVTGGGSLGLGTSSPFNPGGGGQTSFEMSGTNYSTIYLSANSATVRGQIGADNLNAWVEVGARTNHPLLLVTNNTERMRITSNGNVFIGAIPSNTSYLKFNCKLATDAHIGFNLNDSIASIETTNDAVSANVALQFVASSFKFQGLGTGTVTSTSGVLSAVSDMNLKIEDGYIDNALDKILKLTPRYFYWKEETGLPTDLRQLGFFAQEVNEALGEEAANSPKTEKDKWGIYDRAMIAMLTKAIQELKAEVDELKNK